MNGNVYDKMTGPLYDAIYATKDYSKESDKLKSIISRHKRTTGSRLLDVACGTGGHIAYLKDDFNITGLDNSKKQIDFARKKFPDLSFVEADMVNFDLDGQSFDVVLCLFGSVGHLPRLEDLAAAVCNMASHLKPGGVLIIEPFIAKEHYQKNSPWALLIDKPDLKVARLHVSKVVAGRASWDLHFLVADKNGVEYFTEQVDMGLWSNEDYRQVVVRAGLDLVEDEIVSFNYGQDLLIALKKR